MRALALAVSAACVFFASLVPARAAAAADVAIVDVTVVRPERDPAAEAHQTVVISGQKIRIVGPAASTPVPAGATVIDGKGKWVLPGLVDSHVHFFQSANPYTRPDAVDLTRFVPYAREDARNRARLPVTFKLWLASGVTSVIDMGGPMWNFEVRERAQKSKEAPRVEVAGPLISMVDRKQLDNGDPPIIRVTTLEETLALTKKLLARKPDFVKVWFIRTTGDSLAAREQMVKAAADATHAAGARFAVHATELDTAKAALRAGADVLVHSVEDAPVDSELLDLLRRRHAAYLPTLVVYNGYQLVYSGQWKPTELEQRLGDPEILASMGDLLKLPRAELPARVRADLERLAVTRPLPPFGERPHSMMNLRKVWDAGVTVALGTDAGNVGTLHGPSVFNELDAMVRAGLTPREALYAATVAGARVLGLEKDLGTIAAGKLADLVVLDADPLANVLNTALIHRVIRDGRVFDPKALVASFRR